MSPSGFSYLRRDIDRFIKKIGSSNLAHQTREYLSHTLNSNGSIAGLDEETSQMLHELAEQEGVEVNQYALDLLAYTIKLCHRETDERITLWNILTRREQEVAALACQGKTNPEIASALIISEETVKKHMSSVLRKFNIKGRGILRWMLDGWNFNNLEKPWEF